MLILAGLGNPGPKHAGHRHNVGFMAVDAIRTRWSFSAERSRFASLASEGTVETAAGPVRALALKPQTFMNESGRAVGEAMKFFKQDGDELIVFYDEIDLAPGRFRMKHGGGAAGHNGIRSIAAAIGPAFRRARVGVGHPGHKDRVMSHVLTDFHKSEHRDWLDPLLTTLAAELPYAAAGEDERYQGEVSRLAPAEKYDARVRARDA